MFILFGSLCLWLDRFLNSFLMFWHSRSNQRSSHSPSLSLSLSLSLALTLCVFFLVLWVCVCVCVSVCVCVCHMPLVVGLLVNDFFPCSDNDVSSFLSHQYLSPPLPL